jgi:very-short-patch-repair endonuclease
MTRSLLSIAQEQGKVGRVDSEIEARLDLMLHVAKVPPFIRNYVGAVPGRKVEVDFAWPVLKFGIEVQGHVHRIRHMFEKDAEKQALFMLEDWQVLPVTGRAIRGGQALTWALELLRRRIEALAIPST